MIRLEMVLCLAALAGLPGKLSATTLGSPFADHMVLQRERPLPIWGTARPGEVVVVTFGTHRRETTADMKGNWRVELPPLHAQTVGGRLVANEAVVEDVLVGEVWLAGGQSNMDCPTWGAKPRYRDEQGRFLSQMTRLPLLRYATVPGGAFETPQRSLCRPLDWRTAVPENLTRKPLSAVAFYFGRELQPALDVPVGIICTAVGGTNIDAWTPRSGYEGVSELADLMNWTFLSEEAWKTVKVRRLPIDGYRQQPTVLWNGFLAPLAPMAVRGVLWYQGERNCVAGEAGARYDAKLRALYNGWSREFHNPDLGFYVVQLCSWGTDVVAFQETQRRFCENVRNAHLAVINDLGDPKDIHPPRKEPVGRRLAALALKYEYGFSEIQADAPVLKSALVEGRRVRLSFSSATSLSLRTADRSAQSGIELAGVDGRFFPATIENLKDANPNSLMFGAVDGCVLVVSAQEVPEPRRARYLARPPYVGTLKNEWNLPVAAFDARIETRKE